MEKEGWQSEGEKKIRRNKFLRTTLSFSRFDEFEVPVFNGLFQIRWKSEVGNFVRICE